MSTVISNTTQLGTPCPLEYAAQAVVSLWDLKKLSDSVQKGFDTTSAVSSRDFQVLVDHLHQNSSLLSDSCLTAVLVSLKRLLLEPEIPAYHALLNEAALRLLPLCSTEEEIKFAAISLRHLLHLASPSLLISFCSKASEILTPASHHRTLLRCIPVIDAMANADCNASGTLKLIQERARELYREEPSVAVAHCLIMGPAVRQQERLQLESSLGELLKLGISHRSSVYFANLVVWLPVTNPDVLATFWNLVADLSHPSLMLLIRRYLGCYQQTAFRSKSFESVAHEWSEEKLENSWNLRSVALAAQFLLTFRPTGMSYERVQRISEMAGQLTSWSLLELSLGVRAAERLPSRISRRYPLPPLLMGLKTDIHGEIRRKVDAAQTLNELVALIVSNKVLWSSRGHHEHLKEAIAARCSVLVDEASPRSLAAFCRAMTAERLWLPDSLNRLVARAADAPEWLFPVTTCQLPYVCFVSGHVPDRVDHFAKAVNACILRHFDDLPTSALLQAAVALGFFQCLGSELIHRIFALPFMERLDQELIGFITDDQTDRQVRELLATLNRIVCLDFPEERVPWFHEQYYAARVDRGLSCFLDASKRPVGVNGDAQEVHRIAHSHKAAVFPSDYKRIAVLVLDENNFCDNYPQPTGYQQLKMRHLEILGYHLTLVGHTLTCLGRRGKKGGNRKFQGASRRDSVYGPHWFVPVGCPEWGFSLM
ncbi:hypothetical protein HPB48_004338 [Haemaphysalis longicornis]|uniref:RAP domain-containing protein n=1 Tax=Haemaphysalis longicornis TaxID=44386 RepID=A0A9J6G1I7_HAELO|nr:hypothetical protein HPB48_004338 [Haemaphysalis longicornis]